MIEAIAEAKRLKAEKASGSLLTNEERAIVKGRKQAKEKLDMLPELPPPTDAAATTAASSSFRSHPGWQQQFAVGSMSGWHPNGLACVDALIAESQSRMRTLSRPGVATSPIFTSA